MTNNTRATRCLTRPPECRQVDLFEQSAPRKMINGAVRVDGKSYRVWSVPKSAPPQYVTVIYDKIDRRRVKVYDAAGNYLGTGS